MGRAPAADDRESREQHADRMMVLKLTSRVNEAEVLVQRNRFGPTGRVTLRLNTEWVAFEDVVRGS